jgi:hypothetical protein
MKRFGYYNEDYIGQPKPRRSDDSGYYTIRYTAETSWKQHGNKYEPTEEWQEWTGKLSKI